MKQFGLFLAVGLALCLFSCTRTDKVLPKKTGSWNITQSLIERYQDAELISDTIIYDPGSCYFAEDGTGSWEEAGLLSEINWSYDQDGNTVTIEQLQSGKSIAYQVLESERDKQVWFSNQTIRSGGLDYVNELTYTLKRAE